MIKDFRNEKNQCLESTFSTKFLKKLFYCKKLGYLVLIRNPTIGGLLILDSLYPNQSLMLQYKCVPKNIIFVTKAG